MENIYLHRSWRSRASKLRPSNVDPAERGLEELQKVIKIIRLDARLAPRTRWKNVKIIIRGDSAYSRV